MIKLLMSIVAAPCGDASWVNKLCDDKHKLWSVESQKEFTCLKQEGYLFLTPSILKRKQSQEAYVGDVQLFTFGRDRPKMPVVREANADEVASAKKLAG